MAKEEKKTKIIADKPKKHREDQAFSTFQCVLVPMDGYCLLYLIPIDPSSYFHLHITGKRQLILDPVLLQH